MGAASDTFLNQIGMSPGQKTAAVRAIQRRDEAEDERLLWQSLRLR